MKSLTEYLWFSTKKKRDLVNVTGQIEEIVERSGVREGFCLVSAMHITASIWVNDNEPGLWEDFWELVERLAPERPDYKHHLTGGDCGRWARCRRSASTVSRRPSSRRRRRCWCKRTSRA